MAGRKLLYICAEIRKLLQTTNVLSSSHYECGFKMTYILVGLWIIKFSGLDIKMQNPFRILSNPRK